MSLQPVILSGGSGTRLWPLSRKAYPKQFLALTDDTTLLQSTAARLNEPLPGLSVLTAPPMVVCNEAHRFLVAEQLLEADIPLGPIVLEPEGRNTAPALTLAALIAVQKDPESVLIVMPADHAMGRPQAFRDAVVQGYSLAENGKVITFGIVPDAPETGYGYIRRGPPVDGHAFELAEFVEKPDLATAEGYLESGNFDWNSGIFMVKAARWLELIGQYQPAMLDACQKGVDQGSRDQDFYRIDPAAFHLCPSDSIDYAVMEPLSAHPGEAVVIPLDALWSDIGAWSALWAVSAQDEQGNACDGDVFTHDAHDNLIQAKNRMIAAVGVDNLVIVETSDAVLVVDKSRAQDVKKVTEYLKHSGRSESTFHKRVHRPWGSYEGMDEGERFQVKRLTVNPGASLSLQMHHHRAEHWIVVSGTARVTRGDEVFLLTENQSTYIPLGEKHRLENPGSIPLEIIEVQSGSYLGEDDIVRFEDVYNRTGEC